MKTFFSYSCFSLLQHYPHPSWIRSKEGRYLWVNDSFLEFFKVKKEQVIGKFNEDFFSSEITSQSNNNEAKVIKCGIPLTFSFKGKDFSAAIFKISQLIPIIRNKI